MLRAPRRGLNDSFTHWTIFIVQNNIRKEKHIRHKWTYLHSVRDQTPVLSLDTDLELEPGQSPRSLLACLLFKKYFIYLFDKELVRD